MCRLLLVRHGESALGAEHRYAGHRDTPLTPKGREQVLSLVQRFRRFRVHQIYSSDLERCRETAKLLAPDSEIVFTSRLRELNFGAWEGRTYQELLARSPVSYRRWLEDPRTVTPPRGESILRLARRIHRFAREIESRHRGGTLALVTHGGPIRVLLRPSLEGFWSLRVPPASLHVCPAASVLGAVS
jgi:broad specificity phosphatase PhoE